MASFEDWTKGRHTAHLSTNSFSDEIAFQNWRKLKESFAPELVKLAVDETSRALQRPVEHCLDPFAGSGATALACQFLGVHATTIEVNPFLADLAEAKLTQYNIRKIADGVQRVLPQKEKLTRPKALLYPKDLPSTFVEPGRNGRFIFSRKLLERVGVLRTRIDRLEDAKTRRLLRVLLSSVAVELSNIVISGKGRRYRHNWKQRKITLRDFHDMFTEAIVRAVHDIVRFTNRKCNQYRLLRGDSRRLIPKVAPIDMAIFSPPYPNSFDYTDVYNVELWIGGYLKSSRDNRKLRLNTLRSHVQVKRSFKSSPPSSEILRHTLDQLNSARRRLWDRNIPEMVGAYFHDLQIILEQVNNRLVDNGRVYIVVGNSKYGGVEIQVAEILKDITRIMGLQLLYQKPFRSMRSSPQQGGKAELQETLLVFSK